MFYKNVNGNINFINAVLFPGVPCSFLFSIKISGTECNSYFINEKEETCKKVTFLCRFFTSYGKESIAADHNLNHRDFSRSRCFKYQWVHLNVFFLFVRPICLPVCRSVKIFQDRMMRLRLKLHFRSLLGHRRARKRLVKTLHQTFTCTKLL